MIILTGISALPTDIDYYGKLRTLLLLTKYDILHKACAARDSDRQMIVFCLLLRNVGWLEMDSIDNLFFQHLFLKGLYTNQFKLRNNETKVKAKLPAGKVFLHTLHW